MGRKYLPGKLGLDRNYIGKIKIESRNVEISEEEKKIVNKYTTIDVWLNKIIFRRRGTIKQGIKKMYEAKVDDYKFFVRLYEDNDNSLPQKLENYMRKSPCGKAKLDAIKYRFSK